MWFRKSVFLLSGCLLLLCVSAAQAGYIDNLDGTVTDTSTGLIWQQETASGTYTWKQALAYCENLDLAGYTDWRLPTAKELASIVDTSRNNPAINTTYFPDTVLSGYWSSTSYAAYLGYAWYVRFDFDYTSDQSKNTNGYVRAVRSGQSGTFDNLLLWSVPDTGQSLCYDDGLEISCPSSGQPFYGQDASYSINTPTYTKLAAGCTPLPNSATTWAMVRDQMTGLIWEVKHSMNNVKNYADPNDADNTYTWYDNNPATNGGSSGTPGDGTDTMDFIQDLNTSNYGGFSDWRMPTVQELQSIVDYGRYNPSINITYFPNTVASDYWSSTILGYNPWAWFVGFYDGILNYGSKDGAYVRAVRAGLFAQYLDFTYTVSNKTVTIIKYTGAGGNVVIPDTIEDLPVVGIGQDAFNKCTSLTSVTIPGSVTSIGWGAFAYCTSLTSIIIPNSVTSIENWAFGDCTSLTSITIPNSVTNISYGTFNNCTSLTSVSIPNSVTSIGQQAFYNCTSLTSVSIPNSVTSIGQDAFNKCASLTSMTIPIGVTSIGWGAFAYCTGLTSVTIPGSVTSIETWAFGDCTSLTSVIIPSSVTSIGPGAFNHCASLTAAYFYGNAPTMGNDVFLNCARGFTVYYLACRTGFTNPWYGYPTAGFTPPWNGFTYSVSNNTITITGYTCLDGTVEIPETIEGMPVVSIGVGALANSTGLTSVSIPNSVTSIGMGAFSKCTGLTSVTIPNSVKSIGMWAFYRCTSLTSLTIPNSITMIDDGTFQDCTSLTSVNIPSSVTAIASYAFSDDRSLTAAYFYGDAPVMEFSVFYNCAHGFTMYHTPCGTGFTNPMYNYPTALFTPFQDTDCDGVADDVDNCPDVYNPQQLDANHNGIGDVCDTTPGCGGCGQPACEQVDTDGDGIPDAIDNCPNLYNPNQLDANKNGIGDCCDPSPGCGGCGQVACDLVCAP